MTCLWCMFQQSTEGDEGWMGLTDSSGAEHADLALPHEITGSVARHYYCSWPCWVLAARCWVLGAGRWVLDAGC